jgi:hypothetical protein
MKCRGKVRGVKSRQGHRALAGAHQVGNTTGADGTEEHAASVRPCQLSWRLSLWYKRHDSKGDAWPVYA